MQRTGKTLEQRRRDNSHGTGRGNDDALYDRSGGCRRCGGREYYDGLCLDCFEDMGGDGPGRDSMG